MDNIKLAILRHLVKIGADSSKMNIADFLNSLIKDDEHSFAVNSALVDLLKTKSIECNIGLDNDKKIRGVRFESVYTRITPVGESIVKTYTNNNRDTNYKKYALIISIVAFLQVSIFGYLSYNNNREIDNLKSQLSQKEISLQKLQDSLNVVTTRIEVLKQMQSQKIETPNSIEKNKK